MSDLKIGFRFQTSSFYFEVFEATENGDWAVYDSFTGGYPQFTSSELRALMTIRPNGKCTTATDEVLPHLPNAQVIDECTIDYHLPGNGNHILAKGSWVRFGRFGIIRMGLFFLAQPFEKKSTFARLCLTGVPMFVRIPREKNPARY